MHNTRLSVLALILIVLIFCTACSIKIFRYRHRFRLPPSVGQEHLTPTVTPTPTPSPSPTPTPAPTLPRRLPRLRRRFRSTLSRKRPNRYGMTGLPIRTVRAEIVRNPEDITVDPINTTRAGELCPGTCQREEFRRSTASEGSGRRMGFDARGMS